MDNIEKNEFIMKRLIFKDYWRKKHLNGTALVCNKVLSQKF